MSVTTVSSRTFNQDASSLKKATARGPVFITDRGRPAHVLLSIEDYRRLSGGELSLFDAVNPKRPQNFDFDPPRLGGGLFKPADLS